MNVTMWCSLLAAVACLYSNDLLSLLRLYVLDRFLSMPSSGAYTPGVPEPGEKWLLNADGHRLFCRYWEPEGPPRALVLVLHGVAEHSGGYSSLAETLVQKSMLVFAHDHVGHGHSDGERVMVQNFQVYVRDALQHVDLMKEQYPGLSIFIVGHSMGGAIAILTAFERPDDFAGVVLIGPLIQSNPEVVTPFKVFLAKVMNHLCPRMSLGSIDPKWISRDPTQVEAYENDELNYHRGLSVALCMEMLKATERIVKAIPEIQWPFMVMHGDEDKLCDIRGSRLLHEKAASVDKTITVYKGAYHALHHEIPETADVVLKEIGTWIMDRIPVQLTEGS